MRFLWQSQHIEYHAAYTKTNFPRVLHFILCCMHAYTVRHCNCAEGLYFSAFIVVVVVPVNGLVHSPVHAGKLLVRELAPFPGS